MKLPRDLVGADLASALRTLGYEVTRHTGSHMRLTGFSESIDSRLNQGQRRADGAKISRVASDQTLMPQCERSDQDIREGTLRD